jgi:4-hydroxy-tetrahydrodipicolinate reductase
VEQASTSTHDAGVASGVSRSAAGQSLAAAAGSANHGFVYATVAEALESAQVDVLIDYTSAAAVKNNVWTAVQPHAWPHDLYL